MVSQVSPIPPGLKTHTQNPPWRLSSDLYQKVSQAVTDLPYKKVEILPSHPEYQFVHAYFNNSRPTNRAIKHIYCIHHDRLSKRFENSIPPMEDEAKKPVFQPHWAQEAQPQERYKIIQRFNQAASPFNPFTLWNQIHPNVYVLPLWHGTTAQKCNSIYDTGFTYFGKHPEGNNQSTDTGYFGSGIYFTNSARYASDIYGDGQFLLVAWVSMRQPYPVTTDKPLSQQGSDMKKLQGRGAYENYNAHYIPVVPLNPDNSTCSIYYPTPSGHIPVLDEFVVFQRDQALLRFSIEMQVDLPDIPIPPIIPSPLPFIAFGAAKWKEYFGDVGVEPPLPSNIQQILQSPCPFWPDKKVEETHLLVLVPTTVSGKPLTLTSLGELVKSAKRGNPTEYRYFDMGKYIDSPAPNSHWVLMTRDVIPGSRNKKYTDQQALVAGYAQKTQAPYEVPSILDAAVGIWMHYVETGNRLYNNNPWTYTCCQGKYKADWPLIVGGFSPAGLCVDYNYDNCDTCGVGGSRKL